MISASKTVHERRGFLKLSFDLIKSGYLADFMVYFFFGIRLASQFPKRIAAIINFASGDKPS
jgi:hypothetical protein